MRNFSSFCTALVLSSALVALSGCGDVSRLKLTLRWQDADVDAASRTLMFVVREPGSATDPCEALWGPQPAGAPEFVRILDYPNRNPLVAAPLRDGDYTIIAYAFTTRIDTICESDDDCVDSAVGQNCRPIGAEKMACLDAEPSLAPIAGACSAGTVPVDDAADLMLVMENRP